MEKLCLNCGKEIPPRNKYCDNKCQGDYEYKQYVEEWLKGKKDGNYSGNDKDLADANTKRKELAKAFVDTYVAFRNKK